MIFLKLIHSDIVFSANGQERWFFQKKINLFCIIGKDDIPLFRKYDLILKTENERSYFSKKYMEISFFKEVPPPQLEQQRI